MMQATTRTHTFHGYVCRIFNCDPLKRALRQDRKRRRCDASLRSGHFAAASEEANGILEALFIEVSPDLILQCADQVEAPLEKVAHLYQVALELGVMRSLEWEDATSSVGRPME